MANAGKTTPRNPADGRSDPQKVELDRIELPPEPREKPADVSPGDPAAPAKPPDRKEDKAPLDPTDSAGHETATPSVSEQIPPAVWYFLIAIAWIAALIWIYIGALYLFDWLFTR